MTSKSMKPAAPKGRSLEQQRQEIARFLMQEKKSFTLSILNGLLTGRECTEEEDGKAAIDLALTLADYLMDKFYPAVKDSEEE